MEVDLYYHRDNIPRDVRIGQFDFDLHGDAGYTTKTEVERKKATLKSNGYAIRIKTIKLLVQHDRRDKARYQKVYIIYKR